MKELFNINTYNMENKKTRVGKFLQKINPSKALEVVGNLVTGDIKSAVKVITGDDSLSAEEKEFALQVMQLDIQEMKGVSERWRSDMSSDSYLSKNVRPLTLVFLTLATVLLIYIDTFEEGISTPTEWVDLLKSLLLGVYISYFGSRGLEKYRKLSN